MIQVNELKGKMVSNGYNRTDVAKALGISTKTLGERFKKGEFSSSEIEKLIKLLKIDNPMEIFFDAHVASKVTKNEDHKNES